MSDGIHHHGPLAGVAAGAMAVLVTVPLLFWMVWHRIQGAVGTAFTVIVWAIAGAVLAAVVYGVAVLALRLRLHTQRPETLVRASVRAAVVDPPPEVSSPTVMELPVGGAHTHYHFDSPESVTAALRALQGPPDVPR